jgi:hypothetical protein
VTYQRPQLQHRPPAPKYIRPEYRRPATLAERALAAAVALLLLLGGQSTLARAAFDEEIALWVLYGHRRRKLPLWLRLVTLEILPEPVWNRLPARWREGLWAFAYRLRNWAFVDSWWPHATSRVRGAFFWSRWYLELRYRVLLLRYRLVSPGAVARKVYRARAPVGVPPSRWAFAPGVRFMPEYENFKTLYETTTTADPGTGGTSLAVSSRTGSPPRGVFYLLVQNAETDKTNREIVKVTAGHGTGAGSFTITRGQEGTSGLAHPVGSYVTQVATDSSLHGIPSVINPLRDPYNAVGDGVADDTSAVSTAIADSIATGKPLVCPPGFTFLVASTTTINNSCTLDFGGSTIKKAAAMTTDAFSLTGNGVKIKALIVNGNRPVGEVQTLTITGAPTGGTVVYSWNGNNSAAVAWNATAATVKTALEGITGIGAGNLMVSGGPGPGTPYQVTFVNTMAGVDQAAFVLQTNSLTGGTTPSVTIAETKKGAAGAAGSGINNTAGTATSPNELERVVVTGCKSHGIKMESGGGVLIARSCQSNDNSSYNSPGGVRGWSLFSGTVTVFDCDANNNERYGFHFIAGLGDNCQISSCRSFQNGLTPDTLTVYPAGTGLQIGNNRGLCDTFRSLDDRSLGIAVESGSTAAGAQAAEWIFGTIEGSKTGFTAKVSEGTGVNFFGAYRCKVNGIIANANNGYGALLGRNSTNPSVSSSYNSISAVLVDGQGSSFDSDPGFSISGGSNRNYVGNLYSKDYTMALIVGEDAWPQPVPSNPIGEVNAHNYVASVYGFNCPYGGVMMNVGQYNRVDTFTSRNCYNSDTALSGGLVSWYPDRATGGNGGAKDTSWVTDNFVGYVDHRTISGTKPTHVGHSSTNARNCEVAAWKHRNDFATAQISNAHASNRFPSNSPAIAFYVKADRTTTSTTASDVTDMGFWVGASENWQFEYDLKASCSSTGGSKFAFTFPTGALFTAVIKGPSGANTTITADTITVTATLTTVVFLVSNTAGWIEINGVIENSTTAGMVQLQFASVTAAQTTTVSRRSSGMAQPTY